MESRTQTPKGPHMSIDITQQALNALADAGLGNDSPAEAYVIGYTKAMTMRSRSPSSSSGP